jgi:hypothetical protein
MLNRTVKKSLWLRLPAAVPVGAALNLSVCTNGSVTVWKGACDAHGQQPLASCRTWDDCRLPLSLPPRIYSGADGLIAYAQIQPDHHGIDESKEVAVYGSHFYAHHTGPSGYVWECCGGEIFVTLPLFGTVHVPTSQQALRHSQLLPLFVALLMALSLQLPLVAVILARLLRLQLMRTLLHGSAQTARRRWRYLLLCASLSSYPLLTLLLSGPPGQWVLDFAVAATGVKAQTPFLAAEADGSLPPDALPEAAARIEAWQAAPHSSPLAALGGGPVGNLPVWSAEETASLTRRVLALRYTHWSYSIGLAHGSGILLGHKYSLASRNGTMLSRQETLRLGHSLWGVFGTDFEGLRAACERHLGARTRLSVDSHPPTFIIHMASLLQVHPGFFDVHEDSAMHGQEAHTLAREVSAAHPEWAGGATCDFDAQLSVLVAMGRPKHMRAGLDYWVRERGGWRRLTIDHTAGSALFLESSRPHSLRTFPLSAVGTNALRVVLHAFAVPCGPSNEDHEPAGTTTTRSAPIEWWISGPTGGSSLDARDLR